MKTALISTFFALSVSPPNTTMDFLSIFALGLMITVGVVLAYGIIIIHDIPYKIAKARNHPHAEAIEAAGWVSLFLMHAIWPFLWIWAMLYQPGKGFGTGAAGGTSAPVDERLEALEQRLARLEKTASGKPV